MIEKMLTRIMQEKASATLWFTYASWCDHCEKSQNTRGIYHVRGKK
jgi:hypothetical protein